MNNVANELSSKYELLTTPKQILVALLSSRICVTEQICQGFNYSTVGAARSVLYRLSKAGLVQSESVGKYNSIGNVYYLTNKGSEQALTCLDIEPYGLSEDNKIVSNFTMLSENKYNSSMLPHAVSIADFYYLLLKTCGYNNFNWYSESESELISSIDQKITKKPDASFEYNGTKYILEQDMSTESKSVVQKTFTNYAQIFYQIHTMPVILFPINLEYSLSSIDKRNLLATLNVRRAELKELELEMASYSIPGTGADTSTLERQVETAKSVLSEANVYPKSIIKYFKKRIATLSAHLNSNPGTGGKDVKSLYELKLREIKEIRNNILSNKLSSKYAIRINTVKSILLNIDEKREQSESTYNRLLEGLDVYVNAHSKILEFIELHVASNRIAIDIISKYYEKDLITGIEAGEDGRINIFNKFRLSHNQDIFTVDRFLRFDQENTSSYYMFSDISYNNVGAYARLVYLLNNFKYPFTGIKSLHIIVIVDGPEQAMDISKIADNNVLSKCVEYANINTIQKLDITGIMEIDQLTMYSILEGNLTYLYT